MKRLVAGRPTDFTRTRGAFPPVVALLLAGGLGCAGTQIPKPRIVSPAEGLFNGQVRGDVDCYKCHNGDGSGTWRGPNLAKRVPKLSEADIVKAIDEGPGLMPSFKDKLSDAEAKELAAWLRGKFPG
jgi:mono/diheme cytochrome c family protein